MTPSIDGLWPETTPELFRDDPAAHRQALLEQYKLYVEMADRVSQRRGLANSFFLTINTALVSASLVAATRVSDVDAAWFAVPLATGLLVCASWFYVVRSYRQLNTAKWKVVGAFEERLPASPWWRAEWSALGGGTDRARYWPLSHIEQWIPILFAVVETVAFVALLLA